MIAKGGWVYIVSSHSRRLYIGITSDLGGRIWEHKNGVYPGFTETYEIDPLVHHGKPPASLSQGSSSAQDHGLWVTQISS